MHFVPGVLENVVQKELQETMVPDQLPGPPFAGRGEADALVFFIEHQRRTLRRELLKHSCDRRRADAQPPGESVSGDARALRAADFKNGLEIIVNRFRS